MNSNKHGCHHFPLPVATTTPGTINTLPSVTYIAGMETVTMSLPVSFLCVVHIQVTEVLSC